MPYGLVLQGYAIWATNLSSSTQVAPLTDSKCQCYMAAGSKHRIHFSLTTEALFGRTARVNAWLWNGRRVRGVSYSTDINTSHTSRTHTHTYITYRNIMGVPVMFPHAGPKMSLFYLTRCTLNSPIAPRLFNLYFHISPQLIYDISLLCSTTPH
jgi:hypothetical protein